MLLKIAEKNMLQADKTQNIFPNEQKRRTAALGPSSVRGNLLGDNGSYKELRSCLGHLCCFQFFTFFCARIENICWFIVELLEMIVFSSTVSKQTFESNRLSGCLVFILFPFRNAHSFDKVSKFSNKRATSS